jgi:TolB protein
MKRLNRPARIGAVILVITIGWAALTACGSRPQPTPKTPPTTRPLLSAKGPSTTTTFVSPQPQPFDSALPAPGAAQGRPKATGWVAFHSERSGNLDIWIMRDNGSDLRQLTTDPERDIEPDWSPDGSQIVFVSGRDAPTDVQLYVMNADGSNQHALLPFVAADSFGPRWSPDGKSIAFYTNRDGDLEIYVASVDGQRVTNLSQNAADDLTPAWSPDGKQLAFASYRDGNYPHIYVMQADGSNVRQLTRGEWEDIKPDWSPDGKRIVFTSTRSGYPAPWVVPAAGGEAVSMADNVTVKNRDARWAGNDVLVFSSDRVRGLWAIYRMNIQRKETYALTSDATLDGSPAWTNKFKP